MRWYICAHMLSICSFVGDFDKGMKAYIATLEKIREQSMHSILYVAAQSSVLSPQSLKCRSIAREAPLCRLISGWAGPVLMGRWAGVFGIEVLLWQSPSETSWPVSSDIDAFSYFKFALPSSSSLLVAWLVVLGTDFPSWPSSHEMPFPSTSIHRLCSCWLRKFYLLRIWDSHVSCWAWDFTLCDSWYAGAIQGRNASSSKVNLRDSGIVEPQTRIVRTSVLHLWSSRACLVRLMSRPDVTRSYLPLFKSSQSSGWKDSNL